MDIPPAPVLNPLPVATNAPVPPPTSGSTKGQDISAQDILNWTISAEFMLCLMFAVLTVICLAYIKKSGYVPTESTDALRLYLLPVLVCVSICLVIVGYDKEQMNVVMPLLALIAGNLLAKTDSSGKPQAWVPPGYDLTKTPEKEPPKGQ